MHLKKLSLEERDALAERVGTTGPYLSRIAYGRMDVMPGPKLARKLAKELSIPLSEIRPDIWGEDAA